MSTLFNIIKTVVLVAMIVLIVYFSLNNQERVLLNLSPVADNVFIPTSILVIISFVAGMATMILFYIVSCLTKKLSQLTRDKAQKAPHAENS
ncbi:MAG: hypothetical protein OXC40_01835 [Proteobacteria bacterium]|nr:hypothetical protein [Pseudomonadota bacterium]